MLNHMVSAITLRVLSFNTFVVALTWFSAVAGAVITFLSRHGDGYPMTLGGFRRFALPSAVWKHRSPRLDFLYYLAQHFVGPLVTVPFVVTNGVVAATVAGLLSVTFGANHVVHDTAAMWVAMLVVAGLATDFATFATHFMFHKIKPLWEFHKAHHSVEFLIPLSNRRIHPFEETLDVIGTAAFTGFVLGILAYAFAMPVPNTTIAGLDVYFVMNLLSFYHLRHSHIDMSYGRWERWILSPAQHQLHHSQEVHHWDRNFGLCLAIWDRMAGTLLPAERYGTYRLGLPENGCDRFRTVPQIYLTPILRVAGMTWRAARGAASPQSLPAPMPASVEPALPASGHAD